MNSFLIGSTLDLTKNKQMLLKNTSNAYLLKNKQLLKDTLKEGKPYMINDFLNHSDYSYMSETSNEEQKINSQINLDLKNQNLQILDADTKYPTPTKHLENYPTPQDLLNKNAWIIDDNRSSVVVQSFILEGNTFKDIKESVSGMGGVSRNKGLQVVESCLIEENEEAVSNKPILENNKLHGITESNQNTFKNKDLKIFQRKKAKGQRDDQQVDNKQAQQYIPPRQSVINQRFMMGLHNRDESTATLLMEKSPLSTQRSKINLNALMDAYNNLNKHPSVLAFNGSFNRGDSSLSINPYVQGTIDIDNEEGTNINRFVDIFRFSSIELHHFLAAEHLFQLTQEQTKNQKSKALQKINFKIILYQEQFQQTFN
eukprot:403344443